MKLALIQSETIQGNYARNIENARELAAKAKDEGADIALFPEMFLSGFDYAKNYSTLKENGGNFFIDELKKIARKNKMWLAGSVPALEDADVLQRNRMALIDSDGRIAAIYDKLHLFGGFNEDKHVVAGDKICAVDTPFGKIGLAICYDFRFPDIFTKLAKMGAELILGCAAWPYPREGHWDILTQARALETRAFVAAVNQCGTEDFGVRQTQYFGDSRTIDPWGRIVARCPSDAKNTLVIAEINLAESAQMRRNIPLISDRRDDIYSKY